MLGFKDFCNEVREQLPDYLIQFDIEDVRINSVTKNNGTELTAVMVAVKDENVSPSIYIDRYYSLYTDGMSFDEVLEEIRDDYIEARKNIPQFDIKNIYSRENLFVKLVNYDRNKENLANIPHEQYLDMAVTARLLVKNDNYGMASVVVDNQIMENLDMTKEELFTAAKENSAIIFPLVINTLQSVVESMSGEKLPVVPQIYVLTNSSGNNGASCLVYDGALKYAAEKIGGNFRILPSSIHELLLVTDDSIPMEELQEMVSFVNATAVSETDYLSDSVYEYDREKDSLSIAADGKDYNQEEDRYQ